MLLHSRRDIPTKITLVSRENHFHHFTEAPPKISADLIEALFLLATKNNKYGLYNLCKIYFFILTVSEIETI